MLPLVDVPDRSAGRGCCAAPERPAGANQRPPHLAAAPEATAVEARRLKAVYHLPEAPVDILAVMSTADGWDLTVPEDDAELLAELRRHGVRPGQRLHVVPRSQSRTS